MKYGVLGTGMVGQAIAGKLVAQGHEVRMGSRDPAHAGAADWARAAGPRASVGAFADAAGFGDLVFLCTSGHGSVDAATAAAAGLRGKVVVDITNPLDFSRGMPPSLFTSSTESLGERVQAAVPDARVVKALNTVNAQVMVDPARVAGGDHAVFLCGNDALAKGQVGELLQGFGWKQIVDLGDITAARGTESYLLLWLRLWGALGTADFNVRVVR